MAAKLSPARLRAAATILERFRGALYADQAMNFAGFERELRDCWGIGNADLKLIVLEMAKHERYRLVAYFYMQNQNGPRPVAEFKMPLAALYGTPSYDVRDAEGKQKAFWASAFADVA